MNMQSWKRINGGRLPFWLFAILLSALVSACAPAAEGPPLQETQTPVNESDRYYRMYFDGEEGDLQMRKFIGEIRLADLGVIFGDLDNLTKDENGNLLGETQNDIGTFYLNISPTGVGVNLASRLMDGTQSSVIDLNGDNIADIVDLRLPDDRRITIVTELMGLEALENWMNGLNPLCQTEMAQLLGMPDLGCDDPAGGGSGGGSGGLGYGGGIIDPMDIVCAGYPSGLRAGLVNAVRPYYTDGPIIDQSLTIQNYSDGSVRTIHSRSFEGDDGHLIVERLISDFNSEGKVERQIYERTDRTTGQGHRTMWRVDSNGSQRSLNFPPTYTSPQQSVTVNEDGTTDPPAPRHEGGENTTNSTTPQIIDGEPVDPPPSDSPTEGDPGPEGDDRVIARFCANRGNTQSGVERAADYDPSVFSVACDSLAGGPASGNCLILEWARPGDFRNALQPPSSDNGCSEFQQPGEGGECEPQTVAERLRGYTALLYGMSVPGFDLCSGLVCRGPDEASGQQPISGQIEESPQVVTETPTPGPISAIVTSNARCRTGPGFVYGDYDFFDANDSTAVYARIADSSWYQVQAPNLSGKCWVGQAVLEFDVTPEVLLNLPVLQPPATPTFTPAPSAPVAPSGLQVTETACNAVDGYKVKLTWNDNSNNESGFRIYHNGQQVATVGANVEQYIHTVPGDYGQQQQYYVAAYNDAGSANSNTATEDGCLY